MYRPSEGNSCNHLWNAPSQGIANGGCNPPLPVVNLCEKSGVGVWRAKPEFCFCLPGWMLSRWMQTDAHLNWLAQLFKTKNRTQITKMIADLTPIEETVAGRE